MFEAVFLLAAEVDVQGAYEWLERQREWRGDQFLRHLRQLEVLFAASLSYPKIRRGKLNRRMIDLRTPSDTSCPSCHGIGMLRGCPSMSG